MENEILNILKNTRNTIQNGWTQCAYARTENELIVHPTNPKACKHCLWGAIIKNSNNSLVSEGIVLDLILNNIPKKYDGVIAQFNDDPNTTKKSVLAVIDKTIKQLKKKG